MPDAKNGAIWADWGDGKRISQWDTRPCDFGAGELEPVAWLRQIRATYPEAKFVYRRNEDA